LGITLIRNVDSRILLQVSKLG